MSAQSAPLTASDARRKAASKRLKVLPLAAALEAQHTLSAVERFSKQHDSGEFPAQAKYYRDLIPLSKPQAGQQYAFEVDLDACTGCKACVAACHTLNGLDEAEVWRTVGLLHGGVPEAPAQQTVTTSCHHCLEPACLKGCPVGAYEKDPLTGIVKHLDDQCFGCQYCTLMCPYDAPKYNAARGVVRKCDMCSDRLGHGEAPACVQACPNQAIAVRIVEQSAVVESADAHGFLTGAPAPDHTLPTTTYKSKKPMPSNMLPADFYRTRPEPAHPPLVVMLTLSQLAVGALGVGLLVELVTGAPTRGALAHAAFASAAIAIALVASLFHLGRPWLAFRAVLGLRTSWLSREALTLGVFAKLSIASTALIAAPLWFDRERLGPLLAAEPALRAAAAIVGALGVYSSVMVYVATRREQWSGTQTGIRFFGTTLVLGGAAVLAVGTLTAAPGEIFTRLLGVTVIAGTALKLAFESSNLWRVRDASHSTLKRVARVMLHDLRGLTVLRFAAAIVGGVLLPLALLLLEDRARIAAPASVVMLLLLIAAEAAERTLFFSAAPASRMPGGIR